MFRMLSASLLLLVFTVVICCVLYPAAVWGVGQVFFPFQANGSMLKADGTATTKAEEAVGSLLMRSPLLKTNFSNHARRLARTTHRPAHHPLWRLRITHCVTV